MSDRISCIGIPTKDRPEQLQKCVRSYAHLNLPFVIADGSDSGVFANLTADDVRYIGHAEKMAFVGLYSEASGVPRDVVEFALMNPENIDNTTGANRNALLLDSAGEMMLQVDDDTECRLSRTPGMQAGLRITSTNGQEFWYLCDNPEDAGELAQMNLNVMHESLLGKLVSECAREHNGNPASIRADLAACTVRVTAAGVIGDSAMNGSGTFMVLDGPSRERLMASEKTYKNVMTTRQIIRGVKNNTISLGHFCMGVNLGFDNREILPPFLPVCRNSDAIFGVCVRKCIPGALFGYVPWNLMHNNPTPVTDNWKQQGFNSDDLLFMLIGNSKPMMHSVEDNLRTLGNMLMDWSAVDMPTLLKNIHGIAGLILDNQIKGFQERLKQFDSKPQFWADDVVTKLGWLQMAHAHEDFGYPRDMSVECLQRVINRFGLLLFHWPELWNAAKELRTKGYRLAGEL